MAFNAQISLSLVAHESSAGDLSRTLRVTPANYAASMTEGTAANQAQVAWSDARTIAGASETLNLSALPDTRDGAAATVSLTAVKAWFVRNSGTATLTLSGGPFGGQSVAAGAAAAQCDPSAAGMAATGVTVTGSAYEIVLIGEGSVS
jgi:hypothetical protein